MAEFTILHLISLPATWDVAWLGTGVVCYLLSVTWGASVYGSRLATFAFMLMPMAVLQAASTHNYMYVVFFVVSACLFLWRSFNNPYSMFWAFTAI